MHSVSEALSIILAQVQQRPAEPVSLRNSLSRVLAETLYVPHDSPLFDKSLMDGFAVHVATVEISGVNSHPQSRIFDVAEVVTAGNLPKIALTENLATRIMTGAPLPDGCNCVVPIEQTLFDEARPETVAIPRSALPLQGIGRGKRLPDSLLSSYKPASWLLTLFLPSASRLRCALRGRSCKSPNDYRHADYEKT